MLASGECERSAVPWKRAVIPASTSAERMNASRTRSSSNGAWPEFSSMRFEAPGRGASSSPSAPPAVAETIASGCALSITSTSPLCRAAYREAASGRKRQSMRSRYAGPVCAASVGGDAYASLRTSEMDCWRSQRSTLKGPVPMG